MNVKLDPRVLNDPICMDPDKNLSSIIALSKTRDFGNPSATLIHIVCLMLHCIFRIPKPFSW